MLFRILTIRKHKTVTFCDAYSFELYRQQLLIPNELLEKASISIGTIIDATWHYGTNRKGIRVVYIESLLRVYIPDKSVSYKSYGYGHKNVELENEFTNSLNGGVHLARWKHYVNLIEIIREELQKLGIIQISTPILTTYRGTSKASPALVTGEYIGKKYIRITHELELKKKLYMSLASVFEFGYVVRDRYVTKTGKNEFYTLEAVLTPDFKFDLKNFYLMVLESAKRLAMELELDYNHLFDVVEIVDVLNQYLKKDSFTVEGICDYYSTISKEYPHAIFVNAPIISPLAWESEYGIPLETKWIMNNHGLGHGYYDEYRIEKLRSEFCRQQMLLLEKGIEADLPEDYLKYCEYAGIPTYSFNLGIERFEEFFFTIEENNAYEVDIL